MGLGCGGPSRIGKRTGKSNQESLQIIRTAIDNGVNFIDTAESYRTEKLVGKVLGDYDRNNLVISTKKSTWLNFTPKGVRKAINKSLKRLKTDYIDIYNFHAVTLKQYDYVVSDLLPTVLEARDAGKIRHIGITELFNRDTQHEMLKRAVQDDYWDVMMVGFNILNQTARDIVLKQAIEKNIGILVMFAVRLALSHPHKLLSTINNLVKLGEINPKDINSENPLDFIDREGQSSVIVDKAYRFCRDEPGAHVILSGTGSLVHLNSNLKTFSKLPLPDSEQEQFKKIFRRVTSATGQ